MEAANTLFDVEAEKTASKNSSKNRFYTYLVTPVGPVVMVTGPDGDTTLSLRAKLTRNDGRHTVMHMRIADTDRSPNLVERSADLFAKRVPVRMVVELNRKAIKGKLVVEAIAESLLEPKRTVAAAQMNLF